MARLRRERFTIRRMLVTIAAVALVLGIFVNCLRWIQYPHIKVTIINESSTPIYDLRVSFMYGERTAKGLNPGGVAVTEIQSGGDAGIFFAYLDSKRIHRKAEPFYYESGNRGFLEVHITDEGVRLLDGIYAGTEIPILGIRRVSATGPMIVKKP